MLFLCTMNLPRCYSGNCVEPASHALPRIPQLRPLGARNRKRFWKVHDSGDLLPGYLYPPEPFFYARFPALEGVIYD